MEYFSNMTTSRLRFFADFCISSPIASGNRSLRARMATRFTLASRLTTMSASGSVSVSLGVNVPNRYL